eukprot:6266430-Alexandrium_andersonii.AAC.1
MNGGLGSACERSEQLPSARASGRAHKRTPDRPGKPGELGRAARSSRDLQSPGELRVALGSS